MFGYITINKPEMKFREFDVYRSYYCGFCRTLKNDYGAFGQLSLSYDLTFLIMLLGDLYDEEDDISQIRCAVHPFEKHTSRVNKFSSYASDINILLAYYKCKDDWMDERKVQGLTASGILSSKAKKAALKYPAKADVIRSKLKSINECEQANNLDLDKVSGLFGEIMAEVFCYKEDNFSPYLKKMGFFLGKFIYLMDAYDDIEEDIKKGNYNPLKNAYETKADFEDYCYNILRMMMAECSRAFEMLPVVENASILRNILYAGVWMRFDMVHKKRIENKKD
ncbi:MAG: DUF5685 family protein [Butyrivibrio sp.]|nr:DUF5685 family protein [Butyrivibrio sp.]